MCNRNFHEAISIAGAPSGGYSLASGDLCKLTWDIEQKLGKVMTNVIWASGWFYSGYKDETAVLGST